MTLSLEEIILRTVERWYVSRYTERHALVTSYDPKNHQVKVKIQPEGQETGWIPIEEGHAFNGFGMVYGPTPGTGKGSPTSQDGGGITGGGAYGDGGSGGGQEGAGGQYQGDQCIIRYMSGDFESGKVVRWVHSKQDMPPKVESGEFCMYSKLGQRIMFHKDGSISIKTARKTDDANQQSQGQNSSNPQSQDLVEDPKVGQDKGVSIVIDKAGNMTIKGAKKLTHTWQDDMSMSTQGNFARSAQKTISDTAQQNISHDAKQNITLDADQSLTENAPAINTYSNTGSGGPYNPGF